METTAAAVSTTPAAPTLRTISIPPLGAEWHGGIYAGIVRGADGAPDYHLILGPEAPKALKWQPAMDWAASLDIDGHHDFALPTRREQSLLFANTGEHFKRDYYWSGAQYAGDDEYAWIQSFGNGYQFSYHKSYSYWARAVRRVTF